MNIAHSGQNPSPSRPDSITREGLQQFINASLAECRTQGHIHIHWEDVSKQILEHVRSGGEVQHRELFSIFEESLFKHYAKFPEALHNRAIAVLSHCVVSGTIAGDVHRELEKIWSRGDISQETRDVINNAVPNELALRYMLKAVFLAHILQDSEIAHLQSSDNLKVFIHTGRFIPKIQGVAHEDSQHQSSQALFAQNDFSLDTILPGEFEARLLQARDLIQSDLPAHPSLQEERFGSFLIPKDSYAYWAASSQDAFNALSDLSNNLEFKTQAIAYVGAALKAGVDFASTYSERKTYASHLVSFLHNIAVSESERLGRDVSPGKMLQRAVGALCYWEGDEHIVEYHGARHIRNRADGVLYNGDTFPLVIALANRVRLLVTADSPETVDQSPQSMAPKNLVTDSRVQSQFEIVEQLRASIVDLEDAGLGDDDLTSATRELLATEETALKRLCQTLGISMSAFAETPAQSESEATTNVVPEDRPKPSGSSWLDACLASDAPQEESHTETGRALAIRGNVSDSKTYSLIVQKIESNHQQLCETMESAREETLSGLLDLPATDSERNQLIDLAQQAHRACRGIINVGYLLPSEIPAFCEYIEAYVQTFREKGSYDIIEFLQPRLLETEVYEGEKSFIDGIVARAGKRGMGERSGIRRDSEEKIIAILLQGHREIVKLSFLRSAGEFSADDYLPMDRHEERVRQFAAFKYCIEHVRPRLEGTVSQIMSSVLDSALQQIEDDPRLRAQIRSQELNGHTGVALLTFLYSLRDQCQKYGTLTPKQLEAGRSAMSDLITRMRTQGAMYELERMERVRTGLIDFAFRQEVP